MAKQEDIFTTPKSSIIPKTSFVGSGDEEGSGSSFVFTHSGDSEHLDNENSGDNEDDGGSGGGKYETISPSSRIPKKRRTKEIIVSKGEDELSKQKSGEPDIKPISSSASIAVITPKDVFFETTHAPAQSNKLLSAVQKILADFPNEKVGCDLLAYDKKEEEIRNKYQTHIVSIYEKWNRAQEKYKRLSQKDKRKAEKFLLSKLFKFLLLALVRLIDLVYFYTVFSSKVFVWYIAKLYFLVENFMR